MSRTPAKVNQADIARAARVARNLGDDWVVEIAPDGTIRILRVVSKDNKEARYWPDLEETRKWPTL